MGDCPQAGLAAAIRHGACYAFPPMSAGVRPARRAPEMKIITVILNLLRGALIGVVEIIPGVSGGTVALIVGVYEDLIRGASHILKGTVATLLAPFRSGGVGRALRHFREVPWLAIIPLVLGAAVALFTFSTPLAKLIEAYPVATRAVFFGLIAASVSVPLRMAGAPWRLREGATILIAAAIGFGLTSLPVTTVTEPASWMILISAAFAVCALVLPGVSGAFLLVAIGMYEPTLNALAERDWAYLAVFIAGAIIGLALFVQLLQWLLEHLRRPTLLVMGGLMLGSLRALWPWQADGNVPQPVGDDAWLMLGLALAAAAVVVLMILLEQRSLKRR